jgi:hypothetical protein
MTARRFDSLLFVVLGFMFATPILLAYVAALSPALYAFLMVPR